MSSSTKRAPSDSICSFTAERTSKACTTAPSRRAVAIAWRPGHAGAEHQHLGRAHGAGRGGEHREEARQLLGGDQRGAVAGHGGLGGERVHRLGARDPRDRLHGEARDAGVGQRAHRVAAAERVEEADQHGAAARAGRSPRPTAGPPWPPPRRRSRRRARRPPPRRRRRADPPRRPPRTRPRRRSRPWRVAERPRARAPPGARPGPAPSVPRPSSGGRSGGQRARKGSRAVARVRRGAGAPRLPARAPRPHPRAGPVAAAARRRLGRVARPCRAARSARARPTCAASRPGARSRRAPLPGPRRRGRRTPPAWPPTCTGSRR